MARHRRRLCGAEIAFGNKIGSLDKPVAFSLAFNKAQVMTDSRFNKFWWKVSAPAHARGVNLT
jgi:hypothetical protein